ncbi:MAG: Gfo/Idh/MocA family oxidoreductase [Anaerolineales bacterium]
MKDGKLGVGIVGAGSIGIRGALNHLVLPDAQEKVSIAAVCDPVEGRAAAAAEKYGAQAAYLAFDDLLADDSVDVVTLCSPIGLHYEQGMAAIAAGKHVHFNKTMCITVAEADDLIAAAEARGVKLVASPGVMAHPHAQRMRRAVLEGRLGQLIWAITGSSGVAAYHLNEKVRQGDDILSNIDPSWYYKKPGGGPLYDSAVYSLHYLTGIVGPAKAVTAMSGLAIPVREFRGKQIQCEMDDNTFMLLDFGNAFFAVAFGTPYGVLVRGSEPYIYGTKGSIVQSELDGQSLHREGDLAPFVTPEHRALGESHVYSDLMQLVAWATGGPRPFGSAEHARHVIEIFEAAYRSAATGQAQTLQTTFELLPCEALASLD